MDHESSKHSENLVTIMIISGRRVKKDLPLNSTKVWIRK